MTVTKLDARWYRRSGDLPVREAAGGVVVRRDNGAIYVALTQQAGRAGYVLPKGGIEPGETPEQAAIREVAEEAGLFELEPLGELGVYERSDFERTCWKIIHYFLFHTTQVDAVPLDIENHPAMGWFEIGALPEMFWPEQRALIENNHGRIAALLP